MAEFAMLNACMHDSFYKLSVQAHLIKQKYMIDFIEYLKYFIEYFILLQRKLNWLLYTIDWFFV